MSEIEALQARIEALVEERDEHRRNWSQAFNANAALLERAERLEAALRVIADGGDWASHDQQIARAALEPQPAPDAAAIREAYREGWAFAYRQWEATGSVPQPTEKPHDRA